MARLGRFVPNRPAGGAARPSVVLRYKPVDAAGGGGTTPPTFPATQTLTENAGTRSFGAVTTTAGDWLVVEIIVEINNAGQSFPPTCTGLTFTNQNDNGTAGGDCRILQYTAPDASGASRTVTITPAGGGATLNYRAVLTVVRGSTGPGTGKGTSITAQSVTVTRQGDHSAMFMTVGDFNTINNVAGATWLPGGASTLAADGTSADYMFGRWDDSGTAGTAAHGVNFASVTLSTPSAAVLEMLGTPSGGGGGTPVKGLTSLTVISASTVAKNAPVAELTPIALASSTVVAKKVAVATRTTAAFASTAAAKKVAVRNASALIGFNVSGGEFGTVPGTYGTDYQYDGQTSLNAIAALGVRTPIRVPIKIERLQPTPSAAFDSTEQTRILAFLDRIKSAGLTCVIEAHNFGRRIVSGSPIVLGSVGYTQADHVDFYSRLATLVASRPEVVGLGYNEPHDLPGAAGSFGSVTTRYDWEVSGNGVMGWVGEGTATIARSVTAPLLDGTAYLAATKTMAAGFDTIRVNDAAQLPNDISSAGATLRAKVMVPSGAPGTGWEARIEVQNASFTYIQGPYTALTPGTAAVLEFTPTAGLLTDKRGIAIQFDATGVNTSVTVKVDTLQQGTLTGAQTPTQQWQSADQAAYTAAVAAGFSGADREWHAAGYQFSSAKDYSTINGSPWITPTTLPVLYEAHSYGDDDRSGTYVASFATETTNATGQGFASVSTRWVAWASDFINWCAVNKVRGVIGELGWPDDSNWNASGAAVITAATTAGIRVTYWALGELWGTSYALSAWEWTGTVYSPNQQATVLSPLFIPTVITTPVVAISTTAVKQARPVKTTTPIVAISTTGAAKKKAVATTTPIAAIAAINRSPVRSVSVNSSIALASITTVAHKGSTAVLASVVLASQSSIAKKTAVLGLTTAVIISTNAAKKVAAEKVTTAAAIISTEAVGHRATRTTTTPVVLTNNNVVVRRASAVAFTGIVLESDIVRGIVPHPVKAFTTVVAMSSSAVRRIAAPSVLTPVVVATTVIEKKRAIAFVSSQIVVTSGGSERKVAKPSSLTPVLLSNRQPVKHLGRTGATTFLVLSVTNEVERPLEFGVGAQGEGMAPIGRVDRGAIPLGLMSVGNVPVGRQG